MIAKSLFGENVYAYTLTDERGQSVVVSEYGLSLIHI